MVDQMDTDRRQDISYAVIDRGEPAERTTPELNSIATNHGFAVNRELLAGLESSLGSIPLDILCWINESTEPPSSRNLFTGISAPEMTDQNKIESFCLFQSFFMGYYYYIFRRVVHTSSLALQTVEGAWGFRSAQLLWRMRYNFLRGPASSAAVNNPQVKIITRRNMFEILAMLFMGSSDNILETEKDQSGARFHPPGCMGIVGRRTLLINTLLGKCSSPRELAGFTLLDVDVGGIPRDHNGLIMSGENISSHGMTILDEPSLERETQNNLSEKGQDVDVTFSIEADWEGNPDTALICVRHKGRRVTTMSPTRTDLSFCKMFVSPQAPAPVVSSTGRPCLEKGLEVDLLRIMTEGGEVPTSPDIGVPVLVQALDQPRLRYALAAVYGDTPSQCKVATDSVCRAFETAVAEFLQAKRRVNVPMVIVAGMTDNSRDVPIATEVVPLEVYEMMSPDS
ncbi:hypothetical protein OQA88_13340 [Cercophora sp. LCS_1]